MTTWFTSDTHFGHARIIELCNRPFRDTAHMNAELIRRWNENVMPDDTVFHLGDVALGPWVEWDGLLSRLNGYKVLIVGNHDRIFKGMSAKEQAKFQMHYHRWFDEIHDNIEGHRLSDGTVVHLSHFPYSGDSHGEERHREFRLADNGVPLVHGHTHASHAVSRSDIDTLQIHVGVDAWGYSPVSETWITAMVKTLGVPV